MSADDLVFCVNAAALGANILTGVCSELPPGTSGLAVPRGVTATVVLMGGHHCPLPTTELHALARCIRGQTRFHKLHFLQLGLSRWPLAWKPVAVAGCIAPMPTSTLRAAVTIHFSVCAIPKTDMVKQTNNCP